MEYEWDFSKLPEHEHARVIELIELNQWSELVRIHDQYGLSQNYYCCEVSGVKNYYLQALKTGKLNAEK